MVTVSGESDLDSSFRWNDGRCRKKPASGTTPDGRQGLARAIMFGPSNPAQGTAHAHNLRLIPSRHSAHLTASLPAEAAKRLAFVVGNDAYTALPKLKKAVNDARAVTAVLKDIGFQVMGGENWSRRRMNRGLARFPGADQPGRSGLLLFPPAMGWRWGRRIISFRVTCRSPAPAKRVWCGTKAMR